METRLIPLPPRKRDAYMDSRAFWARKMAEETRTRAIFGPESE